MADVYGSTLAVPPPVLTGGYVPGIDLGIPDGLGLVAPWGSGIVARRVSLPGVQLTVPQVQSYLDSTFLASPSAGVGGNVYNYNFEGLVGPQGPPGPAGPAGIGYGSGSVVGSEQPDPEPPEFDWTSLSLDIPITSGITFSVYDTTGVQWTNGKVLYKGVEYAISATQQGSGDANTYIYWDFGATKTQFYASDDLADAVGADKWLMCYNEEGTIYPAFSQKVIHGGLIQAATITASVALVNNSITIGKMGDDSVGADQIDDGVVDTVHIANGAITADQIDANAVTSDKIIADAIVADKIKADEITVAKLAFSGGGYFEGLAIENKITGVNDIVNDVTRNGATYNDNDSALQTLTSVDQEVSWTYSLRYFGDGGNFSDCYVRFYLKNSGGTKIWESQEYDSSNIYQRGPNEIKKPVYFGISPSGTFYAGIAIKESAIQTGINNAKAEGDVWITTVSDSESLKEV